MSKEGMKDLSGVGRSMLIASLPPLLATRNALLPELVDRARPAFVQQPRQGAVGENDAVGLAARAIVALVFGVDDPLHRCAAHRARLAVAAMHGHLGAE